MDAPRRMCPRPLTLRDKGPFTDPLASPTPLVVHDEVVGRVKLFVEFFFLFERRTTDKHFEHGDLRRISMAHDLQGQTHTERPDV